MLQEFIDALEVYGFDESSASANSGFRVVVDMGINGTSHLCTNQSCSELSLAELTLLPLRFSSGISANIFVRVTVNRYYAVSVSTWNGEFVSANLSIEYAIK